MWVNRLLQVSQLGQLSFGFQRETLDLNFTTRNLIQPGRQPRCTLYSKVLAHPGLAPPLVGVLAEASFHLYSVADTLIAQYMLHHEAAMPVRTSMRESTSNRCMKLYENTAALLKLMTHDHWPDLWLPSEP